ncbi:MAG: uracil-xanthine permease family protein [Caldisericum sp.]|uniref:uracil-xanthine permease family protein n=1 Tax=Caldisericum sp. TaxID=2499687 RepID=UPI003D0E99FC
MAEEQFKATRIVPWPVDSYPPWGFSIVAGLQHILTLFGATTLVPILFGQAMGMNPQQLGIFIATVYMVTGIGTLLQCDSRIGSGLPIVQGSSFSFIPAATAIFDNVKKGGGGVNEMMTALGSALVYGGIYELIVGYSGLIGLLKKVITPVVIGPTIMLIGFSLASVAVSTASSFWPVSIAGVILIFTFALIVKNSKINSFPVFIAIAILYLFALIGTLVKLFPEGHPMFVNLKAIAEAPWIVWPKPLRYGNVFKFDSFGFAAILAAYTSSMIESFGDYHSVSYASGLPDPTPEMISKGIGSEGLGCIISGILGGVGTTSYTENIGVIALTGIASRRVIRTGAVILIVFGFLWKVGTIIGTLPTPIIGAAYLSLFGLIGALGVQVFARADVTSTRNLMILGFAFLFGLGLPPVISQHPITIPGATWLANILNGILHTSMAVGGITAGILDNIIPGTEKERGIGVR